MSSPVSSTVAAYRVRWLFRSVAILLGALHTSVAMRSQSMNADGIAYLDLGDAFWTGAAADEVNTTWSPLYAWILGAVVRIANPSMSWEFPLVQLVNFAIYVLALVSFEFFWRRLDECRLLSANDGRDRALIPGVWWLVSGYSLFIYVSLNLVSIWAVTPDMLVSALVYLAAGLMTDLGSGRGGRIAALAFGAALGAAYLAKAAMFPLALVCLALTALLPIPGRHSTGRAMLALAAFLVVSVPWMAAVSRSVGHVTFSDVSRFTYLKHVNQMPWPQWQEVADTLEGTPQHPARLAHEVPAVWEFAEPIGGTYPLGYDPAWWTRGLEPRFELAQQLPVLAGNAQYYFQLFVRMQGAALACAMLLLVLSFRYERRVRWDVPAALVAWAAAALGLYGLVFAEGRYVAPFVLLLWAGLLSKVGLPGGLPSARTVTAAVAVLTVFTWVNIGALNLEGLAGVAGFRPAPREMTVGLPGRSLANDDTAQHPLIAAELRSGGLRAGDAVGFIGYSYAAYWARLARVRIITEIRPEDSADFWALDAHERLAALASMRDAGALAVVSEPPSAAVDTTGWTLLPASGYLLLRFE